MARLSVFGSVINTVLGVAFLWQWGQAGLVGYVLVGPFVNFLLGHWYVSRLPAVLSKNITAQEMAHQWQTLLRLGIPFMGAGLVGALVNLWIRVEIGSTFGVESLGHFQAATTISLQYIGFVLAAMGADYYPRLTGVIHDPKIATRLVNDQTEIVMLLTAPVFIAMLGLTPWVIQLLYSPAFMPAVGVLRWQILGDILKVASWPLGFVILAAGAGKTFFFVESFAILLIGVLVAIFSSSIGFQITGISLLICYAVYLPLVLIIAKRKIGFQWTIKNIKLLVSIFIICTSVAIISTLYWWGAIVSVVLSLIFALYTLGQLAHITDLGGAIGKLAAVVRKWTKKIGVKN
jgi:PST family polysaccharide transporter